MELAYVKINDFCLLGEIFEVKKKIMLIPNDAKTQE